MEGEKLLLSGGWVYFRDVQFYDPECSKQIKPPLGEGRICLTNLRMLLLCAETSSGNYMAFKKTTTQKQLRNKGFFLSSNSNRLFKRFKTLYFLTTK